MRAQLCALFLACLAAVALGAGAHKASFTSDPTGYFFQISDIHLDPQYTVGANAYARCINITTNKTNVAQEFGNYLCDTPQALYASALAAMQAINPKPDFIFWTGDSVPHWLDYTSVEFYTKEMVTTGITNVLQMLQDAFPDTPVYPCLGNHDNYLSDQIEQAPGSLPWLGFIADQWSKYLTGEALEMVKYGGYYTQMIRPGLRLISFNSVFCDTHNLYAVLNQTDHSRQFIWFNATLAAARAANELVYVIGHIVPSDYFSYCTDMYVKIASDYSDIIVGHFFGDRHTDEFRVIRNPSDVSEPTGVIFVMPSLTTFQNQNPTVRQYEYNTATFAVNNYQTYYTDIAANNQDGAYAWGVEYDLAKTYNMPDCTPASFLALWNRLNTNTTLLGEYAKFYWASKPMPCDEACLQMMLDDAAFIPKSSEDKPIMEADPSKCTVCRDVMLVVDTLLSNNASIPLVVDAVADICPHQKAWPQNVCWGFTHLYGPFALPIIAEEGNPQRICDVLGLCS